MTVHGYELVSEWKNSQCGQTAVAVKGGTKYFLKKYQTPVAPLDNGTLDAKTFAHNKKMFDAFVRTRTEINKSIRSIAGPGGNLVIPCDEFIDGNHYIEAAEFVEGAVDEDELESVLAGLPLDVKKLLMQTAAGALFSVHRMHIVHSDLKLKNVLLVKNSAGNYVAKLIDFDSSYFADQKPDEVVGTIDYYSPELGAYADAEDDREEMGKRLGEKSDIFSLGLIFHYYLAGGLPTPATLTERLRKRQKAGKVIYCWVVLNSGCELSISPAIKSPKYRSLIADMLRLNPDDRPSASEVLKRLREPEEATKAPHRERGRTPTDFAAPWEEHAIVFDTDKLRRRGFTGCERKTVSGVRGYQFFRGELFTKFMRAEELVAMKYASKAAVPTATAVPAAPAVTDPWEEHAIVFDAEAVTAKGYVRIERATLGGVHGYSLIRGDGSDRFIRVEMAILQKLAKKV